MFGSDLPPRRDRNLSPPPARGVLPGTNPANDALRDPGTLTKGHLRLVPARQVVVQPHGGSKLPASGSLVNPNTDSSNHPPADSLSGIRRLHVADEKKRGWKQWRPRLKRFTDSQGVEHTGPRLSDCIRDFVEQHLKGGETQQID